MPKLNFLPGPTKLYPTVRAHIEKALDLGVCSWSHRSQEFRDTYRHTISQLKELLGIPTDYELLFFSSATEVMERIIQSTVERETRHLVAGAFSKRFHQISQQLGKQTRAAEWDYETETAPDLKLHDDVELICLTQSETSVGLWLPQAWLQSYRKACPQALLALDMVSTLPVVPCDWSLIDAGIFSVQKGFGLPAGLGVGIFSPRFVETAERRLASGDPVGTYHNVARMIPRGHKAETVETPNVLGIYLLGKVAEDMKALGCDKIRAMTIEKAELAWKVIEADSQLALPQHLEQRSPTVIVAKVLARNAMQWVDRLKEQDILIGPGYGDQREQQIRIANFPTHSKEELQTLLRALVR